MSVCSGL
jgi:hypothetical protein